MWETQGRGTWRKHTHYRRISVSISPLLEYSYLATNTPFIPPSENHKTSENKTLIYFPPPSSSFHYGPLNEEVPRNGGLRLLSPLPLLPSSLSLSTLRVCLCRCWVQRSLVSLLLPLVSIAWSPRALTECPLLSNLARTCSRRLYFWSQHSFALTSLPWLPWSSHSGLLT